MRKCCTAVFIFLFVFFSPEAKGQQEAQFSHNMFNNMAINPGYAGLRNAICATALARQQWVGFRDEERNRLNPETYSFTVDAPIPFIRGGLAIGFLQDQLGYETSLGVKLAYAYHMDMDYGKLGIGAQFGFLDKRFDFSELTPLADEQMLSGAEESRMFIDGALGVFYKMEDRAWAGLSVSQIAQTQREIGDASYQLRRHLYLTAGYNYTLPEQPAFVLSPSVLFKTDFGSWQTDINALITFRERFWGGVSYRLQDAAVILLGLTFEQISIGYSYDVTLSPLGRSGRSWGSHEILVRYCFSLDIDRIDKIQRNVRFL